MAMKVKIEVVAEMDKSFEEIKKLLDAFVREVNEESEHDHILEATVKEII